MDPFAFDKRHMIASCLALNASYNEPIISIYPYDHPFGPAGLTLNDPQFEIRKWIAEIHPSKSG